MFRAGGADPPAISVNALGQGGALGVGLSDHALLERIFVAKSERVRGRVVTTACDVVASWWEEVGGYFDWTDVGFEGLSKSVQWLGTIFCSHIVGCDVPGLWLSVDVNQDGFVTAYTVGASLDPIPV